METFRLHNYILKAENAFENKEYLEGMHFLEDALGIEPTYARAHNHMGWLYLYPLEDWSKAEKHLKLALKYDANFGGTYFHMAHILFENARFEELVELLQKALTVGTVAKSFVYNEFGRMYEVSAKFKTAITYYKQAIKWCLDERELNTIKDNIRRVRRKRWDLMF